MTIQGTNGTIIADDKTEVNSLKNLYKNFIFDIIVGVIALALGIVMLPPFGIGKYVLRILLAVTLGFYLVLYLFDKLKKSRGTIFVLAMIELFAITTLIVMLFLQQFDVFNADVCSMLGIVLWVRGVVALIGMYFKASTAKKSRYDLAPFLMYLLFVSLGMYFFAKPPLTDNLLNWIMCIFFYATALVLGILAFVYAPMRHERSGKKQPPKIEEKQESNAV